MHEPRRGRPGPRRDSTPPLRNAPFIGGGSITSIGATLASSSAISGRILRPTGKPVKGARVESYSFTGSDWYDRSFALTNANGEYALPDFVPACRADNYRRSQRRR